MTTTTGKIKRIVFTGDVFRTDDALEQNQLSNVRWLRDELANTLHTVTNIVPEIRFRRNERDAGRSTLKRWYELLGRTASQQAWAATFWQDKPPKALVEAVNDDYQDALVIAVEMSPLLQSLLDALGVPWVDVTISPIRFLQDLLVSLRFSRHLSHNPAHPGLIGPHDIEAAAQHLRAYYGKNKLEHLDGTAVYFAQTQADRTQITQHGQFFSVDATLAAIETNLQNRRLVVKAHPWAKANPILSLCHERFDARTTDDNTYAILASACDVTVLTISSSVGIEAEAFGKPVNFFSRDALGWIYSGPTSFWAHRSPSFWRELLSPIFPVTSASEPDQAGVRFGNWRDLLSAILPGRKKTDLEQGGIGNRLREKLGYFSIERDVWPSQPTIHKQFYDLDEQTRVTMTKNAIAGRKTLIERWQALSGENTSGWTPRAVEAARMLEHCRSVVDLGCGGMFLEKYLPVTTNYIPVDVLPRDARTVVVDLNRERLPELKADAIVGLGLLEYLFDVPELIRTCAMRYGTAVFSYNPTDAPAALSNRLEHAWVNSFSRPELETIFTTNGYDIADVRLVDDRQVIWRLRSRSTA